MSSRRTRTREQLLQATLAVLRERGPAMRVEDVARVAGVSRQSVYLHFGSKAGILVAAVEHLDATGRLPALTRDMVTAPDAVAALDAAVRLQAEYNPVIYPVAKMLLAGRYVDEAARAAWESRMASRRRGARALIARLQGEGLLKPDWDMDAATDLAWAIASLQVWEQLVVDRGWSKARYERHLRQVLRRVFVAAD